MIDQLSFGWRSALMGSLMLPMTAAAVLLYVRAAERTSVQWLVALTLCVVISAIPFFIGFAGAYDVWPGLTYLPVELTLACGPLMYLYVFTSLTGKRPGWRRWLLAPAALHVVYQLGAFTLLGDYQNKWAFTDRVHDPYIEPVVRVTVLVLSIGSLVAVHRLYATYRQWLPTARSDDDQFQPVWLNHFMVLCAVIGAFWIAITLMELRDSYNYRGRYWLVVTSLLTLLCIVLETLSRSQIAFPKMSNTDDAPDEPAPAASQDWRGLGDALRAQVVEASWYLEPDFSLAQLARRAGLNRSYVSRALNEGLGQSFSEFVNRLRVDHARHRLAGSDEPLLEIAFASGFGSKASFNRAFRQYAGCTPTEYRQKHVS